MATSGRHTLSISRDMGVEIRLKPASLLCIMALALALTDSAFAMEVTLDTQSAKAVLGALGNPTLTRSEALAIAGLPGNEGLIRKANSYHVAATQETFADALVASAHSTPIQTPTADHLGFERLKPNAAALIDLIARIETHSQEFQTWVIERVRMFSPPNSGMKIAGYLIAGGNSGGFAFGEPRFYLNLNYFNEFEPAKVVLAHELYHAVQAVYSVDNDDRWLKPESATPDGRAHQQMCANLANLFANLYQEGSASYIGDPLLLDAEAGPLARKTRTEFQDGLNNGSAHRTLLELSVIGLQARIPVPYDDVYSLGFYVPEPLYTVGYVMAKAISSDDGRQGLAAFLKQPGYLFARRYTQLPLYGKDRAHPALGQNTLNAITLLESGCKAQ
jgi:hypothetical protein